MLRGRAVVHAVFGIVGNLVQRHVEFSDRISDRRLQLTQGVQVTAWLFLECVLHRRQVVRSHPGDAQQRQVGHAGITVHHVLHRIGQRLQLGHRVHVRGALGANHIAQQADLLGCVDSAHAHLLVVSLCRVAGTGIGCASIGLA